MEQNNPHRLPRSVAPTNYDLWLRPDIEAASFNGRVTIAVEVHEPVDAIVLNAIELEIGTVTVTSAAGTAQVATSLDEDLERLKINLESTLKAGSATIDITFTGVLNDKLRGFYRSTFADDDGTEHTIATTQFESTNARRCFPCWDEPDAKATFAVTLDVRDDLLAISAQSEVSRTPSEPGRVAVQFAPTPLMSTYLLAFVVGHLEASPAIDVDGVPVRVIHRPGRGDEITFAHDAAVFCLRWLTDYFGVPYFGEKIDLLAIPDFAFGAMENTGCVTFREVLLLVDPETTTQPEQQRSVAVIAHELAHMWFGNLVTMRWWEGLWLKEAFATFMETSATDAYRPDWKVWEGFALERSAAYAVDALHSTRPIEFEVHSPADAEGMYDVLTYEKGASVVRMLEQYVGPEAFREGIRHYMRTHALGNTVTADLWNSVETATGQPVAEIMHEWIYTGGFPVIHASVNGDTIKLDQSVFRLLDDAPANTADRDTAASPTWKIPATIRIAESSTTELLNPDVLLPLVDPAAMVAVDPASDGFFRVRYDDALLSRLIRHFGELAPVQRYSLLDDSFDLVRAGQSTATAFVELARALRNENSASVWTATTSGFATLSHLAPDTAARTSIGAIWEQIAGPELDRLTFDVAADETDPMLNEVRAQLYSSLGSISENAQVIEHARALLSDDRSHTTETNASIEAAAVRVVASTGDRSDFDRFADRFRSARSPQIERRYLFALAKFDDADAIADLCEMTLDDTVRSQDAGFVLGQALANRNHGPQVWNFIAEGWDRIGSTIPDNSIGRMLGGVQWLAHGDLHRRVHSFLDEHEVPQARKAIDQHRERLDVHVAMARRIDWASLT